MNSDFYNSLKAFFVSKGMTQSMIASDLGTSQAYIGRLFTGAGRFGKKTATRFSELYGLSVPWLLTGEGPMMAADVQTGNSVNVVTHGDNSPAQGGNQRITTEWANEVKKFRDEVKIGFTDLESGLKAIETEVSALKTEISKLESERGRLLSIIENLTGGSKKQ